MKSLTLALNLQNGALSQYTNFDYDGFVNAGEEIIGGCKDGVHHLENSSNDQRQIDAYFKTGLTDFETVNQKRIRSSILSCEAEDNIEVLIIDDENDTNAELLTFNKDSLKLASAKQNGVRRQVGQNYQFKISNTNGCQFSVESMNAVLVILPSKPRGK